ncbi:MAG: TonB-dependent receptor plug domain-containing protein [Candidatus Neomarinimicrobiota bacterium]|nr:TonB-dependent receptor plug domain-containing protein [Candidatus Neomarinimicrobiota bacterium]MEC9006814.1 TonB-dependent receptor plug domain-containing protein [Candidatus Neomarinimicrobiota bacterium]MEC9475204.1 TonB-dependent receptor plug domain-containing protein [Candidatus Neomarinimicrobiota bacterium]MED5248236.1 TonB-dependent receptor plug domain-containing protein [Candidatus Neomarinimicrobiota bacterium]MEE3302294.1 TonB-dependent receptor plug domain-containing protein [|tara:strand:- start:1447 stop:3672 length:2226 start_codon:yes stop_codon:yes gene_type:complete
MKYLILLITLNTSFYYSQTISGTVTDKITGARLSGVNILIVDTDRGVSTDSNGEYSLNIDETVSSQIVQFKHIGYDEKLISIGNLDASSEVFLQPRVLQFEAIETAGIKRKPAIEKDLPQTVSIIQSDAFALRAYVDAGDLLATDQSVQIEESLSGRKTVSIRGGNADDVLVLYNGFRLNRPYDNVFDLSLIDMQNIEQVEIVKGGHSVLYGADAFSGVINIVPKNTKDKNLKVSQQFGSYNSGFWNANGQLKIKNSFLSINQKRGSYRRIFQDSKIESSGLISSLSHLAFDMTNRLNNRVMNGNLEWNFTQDKQIFDNTRDLNKINSTNQLAGMRYDGIVWLLGEVEFAVASHNLSELQDLNNQRGYIYRSLDNNSNKIDIRKYINLNKVEWMFGAQAEDSKLIFWDDQKLNNIQQLGLKGADINRKHAGFATVLKLHSKGDKAGQWLTDLDVSYRYDYIRDRSDSLVNRKDIVDFSEIAALVNFGNNDWSNSIFKISTIASKRAPGLTTAYWVTTGNNIKFPSLQQQISQITFLNPNQQLLKPERMKSLEIGINILTEPKTMENIDQMELQASIFRNDYINKMRATFLLGMPIAYFENITLATMSGFEAKAKAKTYGGRFIGEVGLSNYNISDMSAFPFKSAFKLTINTTSKWDWITIGARWFQEGEQTGLILVPEKGYNEIELPAFSNYDLHLTMDLNFSFVKGQISYSARNLKKNNVSLDGLLLRDTRKYLTLSLEL